MYTNSFRADFGDTLGVRRLTAISYTSLSNSGSVVALRQLKPNDAPIPGTDIALPIEGNVKDVEAGILAGPTGTLESSFVMVTYYRVDTFSSETPGFYARFYLWDIVNSSCIPYSYGSTLFPYVLEPNVAQYGRISLDIHHAKEAMIVYEKSGQIKFRRAISSGTDPFAGSTVFTATEVDNARLPDVSYSGSGVFFSYLDLDDNRIHTDSWAGFGTTSTPITTTPPSTLTANVGDYYASSRLNLAAYTESPASYKFGMVYNENTSSIKLHMVGTGGIYNLNLTNGSMLPYFHLDNAPNYFPAISADNSQFLTCAWYSELDNRYLGLNIDHTGNSMGNYSRVSDLNGVPDTLSRIIALSSHTWGIGGNSGDVMAAYPVRDEPEIDYKFVPINTLGFRPAENTPSEPQFTTNDEFTAFPNPFRDQFQISSLNERVNEELRVELLDFSGRKIFSATGNLKEINRYLSNVATLKAGLYFLQIKDSNGKAHTIKLTKL